MNEWHPVMVLIKNQNLSSIRKSTLLNIRLFFSKTIPAVKPIATIDLKLLDIILSRN